jgi:Holliday junction resolvasome RuvABC endonuclease subunit
MSKTENPFERKLPEKPVQIDGYQINQSGKKGKTIIETTAGQPKSWVEPLFVRKDKPLKNVLALDVATTTGWCTHTTSGTWTLTQKKDESKGMRLIRFRAKLREICQLEQINLIVFEQLASYGKFPNFVGAEMQGVLKLFCEESLIEYRSYAPTEIKKFGTGSGGAKKDKMVTAAQKYKPEVTSDDEADAIILYHLAIEDLHLI